MLEQTIEKKVFDRRWDLVVEEFSARLDHLVVVTTLELDGDFERV